MVAIDKNDTQFYVRLAVKDEAGALEAITTAFKTANINIRNIIQKENSGGHAQVVILTDVTNEGVFNQLKTSLLDMPVTDAIEAVIRVGL